MLESYDNTYFDTIYTVSQINEYLKNIMEADPNLKHITVKGELSNFTNHARSGHFYFTLKDEKCSIRGVMFRTYAGRVRFQPENGMGVVLTGSVRVFERDGAVQLYCEHMEPEGIGALALAFEQRREKLRREGLFDPAHKKSIPEFPETIGIVTSKTGAALQDILTILSRRYPLARVVLVPALVQGELAGQSIASAIRTADRAGNIDVLIVGRGGGSTEDLWCFNEEEVAYAIYDCTIPVISAVGHEIDFTIADLAADLRAPTPSAAAELCSPDIRDLTGALLERKKRLDVRCWEALKNNEERFMLASERLALYSPEKLIGDNSKRLTELEIRLDRQLKLALERKEDDFLKAVSMLEALNPLKVLTRGYTVTRKGGKVLTKVDMVQAGDCLETMFFHGRIMSIVTENENNNEDEPEQMVL